MIFDKDLKTIKEVLPQGNSRGQERSIGMSQGQISSQGESFQPCLPTAALA